MDYPKIKSIFKRDDKGRFIEGEYSTLEFEFLKDNIWVWTEKVDGTNIRVIKNGVNIEFKGKTDRAQIPTFLHEKLEVIFGTGKINKLTDKNGEFIDEVILYGEGYGARIQKGGGNYIKDDVSFVLFDIKIGNWWMRREAIEEMAKILGIDVVPIVGKGTLPEAVSLIKSKTLKSKWGDFLLEGIVLKPEIEMRDRAGRRILTKLKHKDFKEMI